MDTAIFSLGPATIDSTVTVPQFINDDERVLIDLQLSSVKAAFADGEPTSFENAGPRRKIFFEPSRTKAAIVTCGGLCPGLNNVIQSVVRMLYFSYGVRQILGVRYGYEGLIPDFGHSFLELTPQLVHDIHKTGGTILGTSRGPQDIGRMVDTLVANKIDILFTLGGDGTLRGADAIHEEIKRRGLKISVAGIPKTIDNDIQFAHKTFGFATAVSIANESVHAAHAEAKSARNGIGLVKVMGRDSGFIASYVALASNEVDYVFVPESHFELRGEKGFLPHLENRLAQSKHAVVLVAEGAGQKYCEITGEKDAAGNVKYGDVGVVMSTEIKKYFKEKNIPVVLKYIDPSYIIRSVPASADDAVFCIMLAQNAVHGAMAGKSGFMVGYWNSYYTFVPLKLATSGRKKVDPKGYLWTVVCEATGQPDFF